MHKKFLLLATVIAGVLLVSVRLALAADGDPKRGAELFAANCAVCHGADGQGRIGATLAEDFPGINTIAFLVETISDGVEGSRMPAWSNANGGPFTDQDIADVAAYVNGLMGGSEPPAPAPTVVVQPIVPAPGVTGDASAGAVIFAQNCAVCHGQSGQGRIGATLAKSWPAVNPAAYIRSTVERGVDGSLMPAWLADNGGPLTKTDIDNVSAYILSLESVQATGATATPATQSVDTTAGWFVLALVAILVVVGVVALYFRNKGST
jgi:mono/diheme cytochrome c family protein